MLLTRPASVTRYDFRRPNKLNREHVRALEIVNEAFARQMATVLATSLRTAVTVTMDQIEQYTYDEYIRELPSPTMLTILDMPPLKGAAMFHLPGHLAMTMVDRLLGGGGNGDRPLRAPTDIEIRLLTRLLERVFERLGASFEPIVHLEPSLTRIESNPQFAQVGAPTDIIIVIAYNVRVDTEDISVSLAIPFNMIGPTLDEATARIGIEDPAMLAHLRRQVEDRIQAAPVEVVVRFDEVKLPSRRLAALEVGDVLTLDQPVNTPLTVEVAGLPRFKATAGTKGKRVACLITDTYGEIEVR